jgi:F0F1-type ATP synthase membrane subunit b/b'
MGRRPTPAEEAAAVKAAVREAHEAIQELRDLLKQARQLTPSLMQRFEYQANKEIKEMSNWVTSESNRHAADLNASVGQARSMIMEAITHANLTLNPETGLFTLKFPAIEFDDQVPPPYPAKPRKERN